MERDDNVASLFDHYDDKPDECDLSRDWRQRQDDEQESAEYERAAMLEAALDECKKLGLSTEHLRTLVLETGATAWGLRNSLLLPPPGIKCVWPTD